MDVVLGAGIIGVSTALHLLNRGRAVVLLDRGAPGAATSFGNAGLIEASDVTPRTFPRKLGEIANYASGRDIRAQFDPLFLPRLAPWLARYWHESAPRNVSRTTNALIPLFTRSLREHRALAAFADAADLLRDDGWLHLYRSGPIPQSMLEGIARARDLDMRVDTLDADEIQAREPQLRQNFVTGIHWRDAASVSNPFELTRRLAAAFVAKGGTIVEGDASTLRQTASGWTVTSTDGPIDAETTIVALGPWAGDLAKSMGYRFPLAVKRGYHMHYDLAEEQTPRLPIVDAENGFVLSPMANGMRLTTAIEFADRDAPPTPRQLDWAEPLARQIYPLGARRDETPWMGARLCTADMCPIIGPAPRHPGLWFACGHAHHGLTLGPITGRLLAEQICGEPPVIPPEPYWPARFE